MTSQAIIYLNPNANQKHLQFEARNPNPKTAMFTDPKGGRSVALGLGLGFLDSSLYLTQYSIIRELNQLAARIGSLFSNIFS